MSTGASWLLDYMSIIVHNNKLYKLHTSSIHDASLALNSDSHHPNMLLVSPSLIDWGLKVGDRWLVTVAPVYRESSKYYVRHSYKTYQQNARQSQTFPDDQQNNLLIPPSQFFLLPTIIGGRNVHNHARGYSY